MKPIKLLTLTSRNYLIIFLILSLISFGIFYLIIQEEVIKSTDEVLYNRKTHILGQLIKAGDNLPENVFDFTDFRISPYTRNNHPADRYSDTLIYETVDSEWDEFRKLTTFPELQGKQVRLEIVIARLETHEIIESIAQSLILIFLLIAIAFYAATWYLSKKLWKPFHDTLHQLNAFEVENPRGLTLTSSRIAEFVALNKSIQDLTDRTRTAFINQKQFIENASHEMQTPLAIIQSKLELFIEDPHLTQSQSEIVQTLINSTQRLARLNKTLLLLSKIENQQFLEKENIFLNPLVTEILSYFDEQRESLNITVKVDIPKGASMDGNRELIDLFITNLIKNAFLHNLAGGSVEIAADNHQFRISNTSGGTAIPDEKLFQRFYKRSSSKDSWGLGLTIVKKICDMNRWPIEYAKTDSIHSFHIQFATVPKI